MYEVVNGLLGVLSAMFQGCCLQYPNARKIIKVSDEMKQRVFNSVKDAFYKYNGMSGDNEPEFGRR